MLACKASGATNDNTVTTKDAFTFWDSGACTIITCVYAEDAALHVNRFHTHILHIHVLQENLTPLAVKDVVENAHFEQMQQDTGLGHL